MITGHAHSYLSLNLKQLKQAFKRKNKQKQSKQGLKYVTIVWSVLMSRLCSLMMYVLMILTRTKNVWKIWKQYWFTS